MTYQPQPIKPLWMTPAEIEAHVLADCRRVKIEGCDKLTMLYNAAWNQACLAIVIMLVLDVRRAN